MNLHWDVSAGLAACCSIPCMEVSRRSPDLAEALSVGAVQEHRGAVDIQRPPPDVPALQFGPAHPSATSAFFYNAFMPTIRVTIVSPSPGFYNIQFADANDTSINKGFHGIPEARLIHELEKLSSVSAAEITAKLQGLFPIQEFVLVDEATYQSLFAE